MGREIERKFLVSDQDWNSMAEGILYRQGYIPSHGNTAVRVRLAGDKAFLTLKGVDQGEGRPEFEYSIPSADGMEILLDLCVRPIIEKTRYKIDHKGFIWEVDVFHCDNEGLVIAEVELEYIDQEVELPHWITEEVTGDPRYSNSSLVRNPFRLWSRDIPPEKSSGFPEGTPPPDSQLLSALEFAAEKHRKQRRNDAGDTPYINHPIRVAQMLSTVGGIHNALTLLAALLHDTVEDTDATYEEIHLNFGSRAMELVMELSDDKSLPKAERKRLQIENAPDLSDSAKVIKIADFICNIEDTLRNPPVSWDVERKRAYLNWSSLVVDGCRGVNSRLEKRFDSLVKLGRKEFSESRSSGRDQKS